ncbi:hypothetical protein [Neolewinella sp.]|uniref:hypothetical protein n=1 Tax=Neolewinella sp. TaxID=2993543 RepID=UPI003B520AD8
MPRQLLWLCLVLAATVLRGQTPTLDSFQTADGYLAQGNAYFTEGATGEAILAFERGLRLRPNHVTLRNNLRYVREEAGITAPPLPEFFLVRWWRTVGAVIGSTMAYVLALICWWLAVAAGLYWYLWRRQMAEKRRFVLLPGSVFLLGLAVLFYLMARTRYDFLHRTDEAILIAPTAALRVSPTEAASVEAELASGQRLLITDRVGDYVKVTLEDGRQGYLLVAELAVI